MGWRRGNTNSPEFTCLAARPAGWKYRAPDPQSRAPELSRLDLDHIDLQGDARGGPFPTPTHPGSHAIVFALEP